MVENYNCFMNDFHLYEYVNKNIFLYKFLNGWKLQFFHEWLSYFCMFLHTFLPNIDFLLILLLNYLSQMHTARYYVDRLLGWKCKQNRVDKRPLIKENSLWKSSNTSIHFCSFITATFSSLKLPLLLFPWNNSDKEIVLTNYIS